MADGCAAAHAGEPAVRHQSAGGIQTHTGQRRGGAQHLAHARTALGPLVPDHNHVACHNLAGVQALAAGLLAVKALGRAGVHQHLGKNSTLLHHGTVGSQVAIQDGQAAGLGIGVLLVADDVLVHDLRLGDAVGPRCRPQSWRWGR